MACQRRTARNGRIQARISGLAAAEDRAWQAVTPTLTRRSLYDRVIHMEEILTIRVPKGTRRRLERLARARRVTVSQYVRRALEIEQLLGELEEARASLTPLARARGVFTDDDVFSRVS